MEWDGMVGRQLVGFASRSSSSCSVLLTIIMKF